MGRHKKALVLSVLALLAAPASAQSIRDVAAPAEIPPESYTGSQYVDSRGCVFIRAGVSGATSWVPRVSRNRQLLCGFEPSLSGAEQAAAAETVRNADVPNPLDIAPPGEPEATQAQVAEAPASQPAPEAVAGSQPEDMAAADGPEAPDSATPGASAPAAAPASAPARAPVPTPAPTPAPARASEPSAPASRPMSVAEVCEGRFGVQPGYIQRQTGQPVDCGPAPEAAATAAAAAGAAPMTMAQACEGRFGIQRGLVSATTGAPIDCGPAPEAQMAAAAPAQRRITLAEACAEDPHGRYQDASTGRALRCPGAARVSFRTNTLVGGTGYRTAPAPAAGDGGQNAQRGLPSFGTNTLVGGTGYFIQPRGRETLSARQQPAAAAAPAPHEQVSTRLAPQAPEASPGHRWVQVGTFGDMANADRVIARLRGGGLPVATSTAGGYRIVLTGPYSDRNRLARALQAVRGAGFPDAFTRN